MDDILRNQVDVKDLFTKEVNPVLQSN